MDEVRDKCIRFDWAIKRLLRQKANFDVLEGFLTVFIGEKITIVEILESEGNQSRSDDKFNRVDIKAKNDKGEIIIIEVQNTRELYFLERILYGVAKAITEHIQLGDRYEKVKKVYSISILYFDLGKGTDFLYHGQNRFIGVHTHDCLQIKEKEKKALVSRAPEEIFPEYILIRVNEFNKVAVTPIEEWVQYLKEGVISPDTQAPGLGEARKKLSYYSMTKQERMAYDEHLNNIAIELGIVDAAKLEGLMEGHKEGHKEGLAKGREEGLAKGREEGLLRGREEGLAEGRAEGEMNKGLEIARQMKAEGLPLEMIARCTGLSMEQIKDLKSGEKARM